MTHLQWDNKLPLKHLLILLFIAIAYGSAFPVTKLALNDSVPTYSYGLPSNGNSSNYTYSLLEI
jgi:hypothetical protein